MASRVRWFGLGLGVGTYLALKGERVVKERVAQAKPGTVARRAGDAVISLTEDLRESIAEGIETVRGEIDRSRHGGREVYIDLELDGEFTNEPRFRQAQRRGERRRTSMTGRR